MKPLLAKSALHANTSLTVSGHVMGTPHFVAPEALTLGSSVDHRADIYAVGVMLYQMLTGKLPQGLFEMPSMQVPGLDPRYDTIVAAAMRENRDQRYQHIHDMRRALDAIVTQPVAKTEAAKATPQRTVGGPPPQKPRAPGQPQRKVAAPAPRQKTSSTGWAAFFIVLLALAGGAFWLFRSPTTGGKARSEVMVTPSSSAPSTTTKTPDAANLLTNGSFESKDLSQWRLQGTREDKEAGSFEPNAGRNNSTAAVLRSEKIHDIRFMQTVKVTPNTDYVVSGWLKTQGVVQEDGKLRGAGLSVLGGFEGTEPIGGDNDWTLVQFTFNSKERTEVEICARLGFFGAVAKGTIWFDDLRMERAGIVATKPSAPPNSSPQTDPYASSAPRPAAPAEQEDYSALALVTIYGVAREEAAGYLGQARLKSDPAYFAKRLTDSAIAGFASVVANLAVSSRFGEDSKVKSQYSIEFSFMGKSGEPTLNLDLSSLHAPSGSRLKALDRPVKRGETIYLGSFDEETADPARPVRIAFLTFR